MPELPDHLNPELDRRRSQFLLALMVLLLFVGVSAASYLSFQGMQQPAWGPYSSEEGNFQVDLPGKVEVLKNTQSTPYGDAELSVWSSLVNGDKDGYFVGYSEVPLERLRSTSLKEILNEASDGTLKGLEGSQQLSRVDVRQNGFLAQEMIFTLGNKKGYGYFRVILCKTRLYTLYELHLGRQPPETLQSRMFESFKLLP